MREIAVFVRRCVRCHHELDRLLICPEGHSNAIVHEEWEVFDTTHGIVVATTIQFAVKTKRGVRASSKVIWTDEAEQLFPTKELHGRNGEGYTAEVNGDPLARAQAHRPRRLRVYGRPMSARLADTSGPCPECGKWRRSVEQHQARFHPQRPTAPAALAS